MKIVLLEPYMTGSHAAWAKQYQAHSSHDVEILGLEGKYWKWRMHGGAVSLARTFLEGQHRPDLIVATDMLDLSTFLALTRKVTADIPVVLYMHENQLSYPWSPNDADPSLKRDAHYCFINYSSALVADKIFFNSDFHRKDFLAELPTFLNSFPDHNEVSSIDAIAAKSETLHLGLDLKRFDPHRPEETPTGRPPLLLWNHRWEYDKNPEEFFNGMYSLQERGIDFELAVLGESYGKQPAIFAEAQQKLNRQIVHWGFADSFAEYANWLWMADILPVTSIHDFFGVSVVEAIYCGCLPILPRRLAYPEHVSGPFFSDFFYEDSESFQERLGEICLAHRAKHSADVDSGVFRYDWSNLAPVYDVTFEIC